MLVDCDFVKYFLMTDHTQNSFAIINLAKLMISFKSICFNSSSFSVSQVTPFINTLGNQNTLPDCANRCQVSSDFWIEQAFLLVKVYVLSLSGGMGHWFTRLSLFNLLRNCDLWFVKIGGTVLRIWFHEIRDIIEVIEFNDRAQKFRCEIIQIFENVNFLFFHIMLMTAFVTNVLVNVEQSRTVATLFITSW